MTTPKYDQDFWEQLWWKTLREQADKLARRPPNAQLMAKAGSLPPISSVLPITPERASNVWQQASQPAAAA